MQKTCVRCGRKTSSALGVHVGEEGSFQLGGLRFHCGRCTAEVMAERRGERFTYLEVEPLSIEDRDGRPRTFHFQYHTTGPLPGLEAIEMARGEPCGYRVGIVSEPGESGVSLVGRLLAKIRRELARVHVVADPHVSLGMRLAESLVRGRIECDPSGDGPCVWVDGRRIDWNTFGELLLSHEGWQFRLEFHDPAAEVP